MSVLQVWNILLRVNASGKFFHDMEAFIYLMMVQPSWKKFIPKYFFSIFLVLKQATKLVKMWKVSKWIIIFAYTQQ